MCRKEPQDGLLQNRIKIRINGLSRTCKCLDELKWQSVKDRHNMLIIMLSGIQLILDCLGSTYNIFF